MKESHCSGFWEFLCLKTSGIKYSEQTAYSWVHSGILSSFSTFLVRRPKQTPHTELWELEEAPPLVKCKPHLWWTRYTVTWSVNHWESPSPAPLSLTCNIFITFSPQTEQENRLGLVLLSLRLQSDTEPQGALSKPRLPAPQLLELHTGRPLPLVTADSSLPILRSMFIKTHLSRARYMLVRALGPGNSAWARKMQALPSWASDTAGRSQVIPCSLGRRSCPSLGAGEASHFQHHKAEPQRAHRAVPGSLYHRGDEGTRGRAAGTRPRRTLSGGRWQRVSPGTWHACTQLVIPQIKWMRLRKASHFVFMFVPHIFKECLPHGLQDVPGFRHSRTEVAVIWFWFQHQACCLGADYSGNRYSHPTPTDQLQRKKIRLDLSVDQTRGLFLKRKEWKLVRHS